MSTSGVLALTLCALATICILPLANVQALAIPYDSSSNAVGDQSDWETLRGLYNLLAQHDALDGHILTRKSVRSPSRRLRFGRSDPETPVQAPQVQDRRVRVPSLRLRFGRRSDNNMFVMPYESTLAKEMKSNGSLEDDRQQE